MDDSYLDGPCATCEQPRRLCTCYGRCPTCHRLLPRIARAWRDADERLQRLVRGRPQVACQCRMPDYPTVSPVTPPDVARKRLRTMLEQLRSRSTAE